MTTNIYRNEWLDQVFEKRNKKYGAYYLRQHADNYTLSALFYSVTFVILVIATPLMINLYNGNDPLIPLKLENHIFSMTEVVIPVPPVMEITKTNIKTAAPKLISYLVKPIIVENDKIIDDKTKTDLGTKDPNNLNALSTGNTNTNDTALILATGNGNALPDIDTLTYRGGVEIMPQFPGGEEAMMKFLVAHLKYPQLLIEAKITGTVYLSFIVNKQGEVTGIETLKGVKESRDFEVEAKRVIAMMPKWKPGRQNGQNVSVYFTLPVRFSLR